MASVILGCKKEALGVGCLIERASVTFKQCYLCWNVVGLLVLRLAITKIPLFSGPCVKVEIKLTFAFKQCLICSATFRGER